MNQIPIRYVPQAQQLFQVLSSPEDRGKRSYSQQPMRSISSPQRLTFKPLAVNEQIREKQSQVEQQMQRSPEQVFSVTNNDGDQLNFMINSHFQEVDSIKSEFMACQSKLEKVEHERILLIEKIDTLEKQKMLLERQLQDRNALEQSYVQVSNENQQLKAYIQQLQMELHNCQINLANIYHNHEIQIQELHNSFNNELVDQHNRQKEEYREKMEKVLAQLKQELETTALRENTLLQQIQQRQEEWLMERQRLLDTIAQLQSNKIQPEISLQSSSPQQIEQERNSSRLPSVQSQQQHLPHSYVQQTPQPFQTQNSQQVSPIRQKTTPTPPRVVEPDKQISQTKFLNDSFVYAEQDKPEKLPKEQQENRQPTHDSRNLGVYSLNTFKRTVKSHYDPTYSYSGGQELYSRYFRKDEQNLAVIEEKSKVLQENTKFNQQTQENCRQLLQGSFR